MFASELVCEHFRSLTVLAIWLTVLVLTSSNVVQVDHVHNCLISMLVGFVDFVGDANEKQLTSVYVMTQVLF